MTACRSSARRLSSNAGGRAGSRIYARRVSRRCRDIDEMRLGYLGRAATEAEQPPRGAGHIDAGGASMSAAGSSNVDAPADSVTGSRAADACASKIQCAAGH